MQIDNSHNVKVSGTVQADSRMSLDHDALEHIMGILTNLYSDKYLAVIREYCTNGRDAHVQAGKADLPIQVTLPTALNPTLVITDNGVGLSREELLGIYSTYGSSSKRNTNSQVGSFGLGSKSAFTIAGQFVVTSRKDGRQVSAVFALDATGVGTRSILHDGETTEGNGTTVAIPVSEPYEMQEAARKFFRAWRPGTVLVNDEIPENYYDSPTALWLSDDILFTRKGGITVVMGSVAYPLPSSAVHTVRERAGLRFPTYGEAAPGLLIELPIGAVDITPSREGIRDTERSLKAVTDVLRTMPKALIDKLQAQTASAKDDITRIFAARKLLAAAEHLNVKVSGALPARISLPVKAVTQFGTTSRGGLRLEELDAIAPETVHLLTVLVGVPAKRSAKRHAKAWIEDQTSRRSTLIMVGDGEATEGSIDWFRYGTDSPVQTVHFDDIELPAREYSSSGERAAITYSTNEGSKTPSEIKAAGKPVVYVNSWTPTSHPALSGYLTVSLTSRQKLDVFLRRVPGAKPGDELVTKHNEATLRALGDTSELANGYYLSSVIDRISYALGNRQNELTHPQWIAVQQSATAYKALSRDVQLMVQRAHPGSRRNTVAAPLFDALPLLELAHNAYNRLDDKAVDHLIAYANALQA